MTKAEQRETEYIKLSVANLGGNFDWVNSNFSLCDIFQRKEKEIKTK